jgi:hypothetical protein
MTWRLPDALERCPTCGRFVEAGEGYSDLPPGGVQSIDYLVGYCTEFCADQKPIPAIYEDTPEMVAWEREWKARRHA